MRVFCRLIYSTMHDEQYNLNEEKKQTDDINKIAVVCEKKKRFLAKSLIMGMSEN